MGSTAKKAVVKDETSSLIQLTDLRSITRMSDKCLTTVTIHLDWEKKTTWLQFGAAQLRTQKDRPDGRHRLEARMTEGVTDFEHDSAYALRLPLVGLFFEGVEYHQSTFSAWIDPNDDPNGGGRFTDFHVPRSGYDPTKHPETHKCKQCKGKESHLIVPEGFYVPRFDKELYEAVRGKRVDIRIGPTFKDDD